jgi:hypothetical protein
MNKNNTGHDLINSLLKSSLFISLKRDVLIILRWENDRTIGLTMTKRRRTAQSLALQWMSSRLQPFRGCDHWFCEASLNTA